MILLQLFLTFFKIGLFTFGGGYAMLPLIEKEVIAHSWMTMEELIDFIAVSESTPGPFAVNISTYIGTHTAGLPGALFATCGVVLPSFIIILIVAGLFKKFRDHPAVKEVMNGLKPAVVGLIASALLSLILAVFAPDGLSSVNVFSESFLRSFVIFLIIFLLNLKKVKPVHLILISAVLGVLCGYLLEAF